MVGRRALRALLTALQWWALPPSAAATWLTVGKVAGQRPLLAAVVAAAGGVQALAVGAPPLPRRRRQAKGGPRCPPGRRQRGWPSLVATARLRLPMVGARPLLPRIVGRARLGARAVVGREGPAVAAVGLVAAGVAGARAAEAVRWVVRQRQKVGASRPHLRPLLGGRRLHPRRPPHFPRHQYRRLRRRLQRRQRHRRLTSA